MGGWGSGGRNKKNQCVEDQKERIDSFGFADMVMFDKYLQYKNHVDIRSGYTHIRYIPESKSAFLYENGRYTSLELSRVDNIDGITKRVYFLCPQCGRRVRYLYRNWKTGCYHCRTCAGLTYKSQRVNGMYKIRLRMERILEKELHYTSWRENYAYAYMVLIVPRPRYMRLAKYEALIQELRELQQAFRKGLQHASDMQYWFYLES